MSNEGRSKLEGWIEKRNAQYPIVSSKSGQDYGIRAYPTYMLVAADGKILQHGRYSEDQIEAALKSVVTFPKLPKSSFFKPVAKAIQAKKYGDLSRLLTKLLQNPKLQDDQKETLTSVKETLHSATQSALGEIKAADEGPDYLSAMDRLKGLQKQFAGTPVAAEAKTKLAELKADKKVKREVSAQKALLKAKKRFPLSKRSSKKKLVKALESFCKKYRGTYAAGKAEAMLTGLRK